jgi:transcriptional regulator with AAA-type ATPase domain
MKNIEIFYRDELISEHPLSKDETKIGRAKSNDIILNDPSVSRVHAVIMIDKGKLSLLDKSSSDTFINNVKVSRKELHIDDMITIGPYSIFPREYKYEEEKPELQTTCHEKTLAFSLITNEDKKSFLLQHASLVFTKGPEEGLRYQIDKEKSTFGKSDDNDLVLNDEFVSRHHGEISFSKGEFFIRDLGSRNGIFVNGKRVKGSIIESGSKIEIGKTGFNFILSEDTPMLLDRKDDHLCEIIGISQKIQALLTFCKKAASCDATILINGETGTGKELIAKTIHSLSRRSSEPFITIDCGSIPRDLIESELFGHEKGAFTGAQNQRKGAFERGHKGTVFLDEIGELPKEMQPKLLRILEEREFKRVGGDTHIQTDIRVIAATNKELNVEITKGNFREDLFFRLYVIPISLPTLRERKEDIPLLTEHFIKKNQMLSETGSQVTISDEALQKMSDYSWPGNVRELRNIIERAIVNSDMHQISAEDIQFIPTIKEDNKSFSSSNASLEEVEKQTIINALKEQGGNKKATAKVLGIAYSTMCEKVKKYKIEI